MTEVLKLTREVGKAIQATEAFKKLNAAKLANDNDEALQQLIGAFNLKRVAINQEVSKTEKDSEKIRQMDQELKDAYNAIMQNPNMIAYNDAKQEIDVMMNQVNAILVMSVNGEDPETCDPAPSGCSGSCSSCGGCH